MPYFPPSSAYASTAVMAIYNSNSQTFPSTEAATTCSFNSMIVDTHNAVTTGSNWHFTVPVAGYYSMHGMICIATALTGTVVLLSWSSKNNSECGRGSRIYTTPPASASWVSMYNTLFWDTVTSCSVGDQLAYILYSSCGTALTTAPDAWGDHVEINRIPYL